MFDGKKLTTIMRSRGLTNAKLTKMVNEYGVDIKEDSFKAYRQGRANPRMEVFDAIVRVLDIPEQELFENSDEQKSRIARQEILDHASEYASLIPANIKSSGVREVRPLKLDKGIEELKSTDRMYIETRTLPESLVNLIDENTAITRIVGNSMSPKINENDILMVDMINGRDFIEADGTYLVRCGEKLEIKTVQFLGDSQINLISSNADYPSYNPSINGIEYEILGKLFIKTSFEEFSKIEIK